jgi:hypothetical protein
MLQYDLNSHENNIGFYKDIASEWIMRHPDKIKIRSSKKSYKKGLFKKFDRSYNLALAEKKEEIIPRSTRSSQKRFTKHFKQRPS